MFDLDFWNLRLDKFDFVNLMCYPLKIYLTKF